MAAMSPISLPSIHEMFPEHLLKVSPSHRLGVSGSTSNSLLSKPLSHSEANLDAHVYSFDVLRSDPSSSSLQHIASSATIPNRPIPGPSRTLDLSSGSAPVFRVKPASLPSTSAARSHSQADHATYSSEELSDDGDDKKHVCATCHKRFNRPSSLRIHINTHTGATPFRCPYPNCGREFNVNSNMRRHYRNHSTPSNNRTTGKEDLGISVSTRRRKRRSSYSPTDSTQIRARSQTENNFLVLRPEAPVYPVLIHETRDLDYPSRFLAPGHTSNMAEVSEESDTESSPFEEDELMDDMDNYPESSHIRRPYRLQPVLDFRDRYSVHTLYNQSDIRSLPPPPRPSSASTSTSSSRSPPPASPLSPGSSVSSRSPGLPGYL